MSHKSIQELRSIAEKAALISSDFLSLNFNDSHLAYEKADKSKYTNIDIESEKIIMELLRAETPDFDILSEETKTEKRGSGEYTWIIDPLDGTHNYYHHVPLYANQIALVHKGEVVLGVIALPAEKLIVSAIKGEGLYIDGKKFETKPSIEKGTMLFFESNFNSIDIEILKNCSGKFDDIRALYSACVSMVYVALGRGNVVIDKYDKPWDLAAGSLIVQESGGTVTNFKGLPFDVFNPECVASKGVDHNQIINLIQ